MSEAGAYETMFDRLLDNGHKALMSKNGKEITWQVSDAVDVGPFLRCFSIVVFDKRRPEARLFHRRYHGGGSSNKPATFTEMTGLVVASQRDLPGEKITNELEDFVTKEIINRKQELGEMITRLSETGIDLDQIETQI